MLLFCWTLEGGGNCSTAVCGRFFNIGLCLFPSRCLQLSRSSSMSSLSREVSQHLNQVPVAGPYVGHSHPPSPLARSLTPDPPLPPPPAPCISYSMLHCLHMKVLPAKHTCLLHAHLSPVSKMINYVVCVYESCSGNTRITDYWLALKKSDISNKLNICSRPFKLLHMLFL